MVPSDEVRNFIHAIRGLRRLYGNTPAASFWPLALQVVREDMIRQGTCRNVINRRVKRIVQIFRWAVSQQLIKAPVYAELATVDSLRKGRSAARESEKVRKVHPDYIEPVLKILPAPVAAMARLQLLTGARGGELFIMRTCDIDTSGRVWQYTPTHHKTEGHDIERVIPIGAQAQDVLRPFLRTNLTEYIFQPADAAQATRDRRHAERATADGQGNTSGTNCKTAPMRKPRLRYDIGRSGRYPTATGTQGPAAMLWVSVRANRRCR
jgi:integrase